MNRLEQHFNVWIFLITQCKTVHWFVITVQGLNTSCRKVELIGRTFSAMELGMDIIESTERQQKIWNNNYQNKLWDLEITDTNSITEGKK